MKIKLKRSFIGMKPVQRRTLKALGFKRPNQVLEVQDNASIQGMIKNVQSFVEVIK